MLSHIDLHIFIHWEILKRVKKEGNAVFPMISGKVWLKDDRIGIQVFVYLYCTSISYALSQFGLLPPNSGHLVNRQRP